MKVVRVNNSNIKRAFKARALENPKTTSIIASSLLDEQIASFDRSIRRLGSKDGKNFQQVSTLLHKAKTVLEKGKKKLKGPKTK